MLDREKVKKWFDMGLWTKENVRQAVYRGKLTEEDYRYITGEDYV